MLHKVPLALQQSITRISTNRVSLIFPVVERRLVELEDLTPSFHNGWANGTIDQINTRHLEQLYDGDLAVNVATTAVRSVVRGRLSPRPVADARDSPSPSLLLEMDKTIGDLTGMVWAAVDNECNLHYEVGVCFINITIKNQCSNVISYRFQNVLLQNFK